MTHYRITFKPDNKQELIHEGANLLEAAGQAGIILNTACGGTGYCGKCGVLIDDAKEVLACQYEIKSDVTVTVPQQSRFYEAKILTSGIEPKQGGVPDIYKKYEEIAGQKQILGAAIDIGTTTVVVKLVDMRTAEPAATEATMNPQARFGDDVISRISYANTESKRAELNRLIIDCLNNLIGQACQKAKVKAADIYEAAVVGNTTMNHLFLNLPVEGLGRSPYKPYSSEGKDVPAGKLGIGINPEGNVHTVELIAGFVGADTVGAAIACGIADSDKETILVDIGTNGEVVMGKKGKLLSASCAAGPAFEGAKISCGSRAVKGAIQAVVKKEGDIDVDVIGGCSAKFICGSGLLDAVAVMLELGVIDSTGKFSKSPKAGQKILSRIIEYEGEPAFILAKDAERMVVITQRDIRQFQLAKAAIRAGIKILQQKLGIGDEDIEQVLLAGAFGNFLRPTSALRTGVLPNVEIEKIKFIGNAALSGAEMVLLNSRWRKRAKQLAKKIKYIELAGDKDFQQVFAQSMSLANNI
jgi:uncharacterized 2Fe-2S/4Fe-4S cluster protein (DUF4445 family)